MQWRHGTLRLFPRKQETSRRNPDTRLRGHDRNSLLEVTCKPPRRTRRYAFFFPFTGSKLIFNRWPVALAKQA
jgi:hypothetical protein